MSKISSKCRSVTGVLGLATLATALMAQAPAGQSGEQSQPGYAMMYGYPGGVPWMMRGAGGPGPEWGGRAGFSIQNRLDALKTELNITAGQADAWNIYASAVAAARHDTWSGMRSIWQSNSDSTWGPDQRFAAMDKAVALMKQGYDQEKKAADALMPHLTPYQQGQAKEILPGVAKWGSRGMWGSGGPMWGGGVGPGFGMGWGPVEGGMMGW